MGQYKAADNAATTLAASVTSSTAVTSLVLTNATNFPVINHGGTGSDWSYVTLFDSTGNIETVKVTRHDAGSNALTIVRGTASGITGVNDASCRAWSSVTTGVACRLIAAFINDILALTAADHVADTTSAHAASAISFAPTGAIAATDVQAAIAELDSEKQVAQAVTGIVKSSGTTRSAAVAGTDYQAPIGTISGIAKGNGANALTAAVAGTDYLAPAAIGTTVQAYDAQLFSNIPQNSKSAAYTLVATDAQKHILHPSADTTARTFTIPANASVAYPIGTAITFINQNGAGVVTIAITTDTMRLAGAGTTGSRTLAANGLATAIKVTSTEWIISGTGLT